MRHSEQHHSVSSYNTPKGGGVVGVVALIGMGIMLLSDGFARSFLAFSVPAGGLIALALYLARRWKES
jgi:hypothetical protein